MEQKFKEEVAKQSIDELAGCLEIDLSFIHTKEEVLYIAKSIKLIAEKGEELQRFYDKHTFLMNHYSLEHYDFAFSAATSLQLSAGQAATTNARKRTSIALVAIDFPKNRAAKFDAQLVMGKAVFKNY